MKTENKLVIILFVMAFSTVFLLYAVISEDNEASMTSANSVVPTQSDIGRVVYTEGVVLSKRMTFTGDHLIIQMECADRTVLPVFVPRSAGASSIFSKIDTDSRIGVRGTVNVHNGTLQLVLRNERDLRVLS